jgi:hypothetical protein
MMVPWISLEMLRPTVGHINYDESKNVIEQNRQLEIFDNGTI